MTVADPNRGGLVPPSAIQPNRNAPPTYGEQAAERWEPGKVDERQLLDGRWCEAGGWRLTVVGDVKLSAIFGTKGSRRVVQMDAPLIAQFTGQVSIYAVPRDPNHDGVYAVATMAPATSGFETSFRRMLTGNNTVLEPDWSVYQALTASVVSVRGTNVNVPVLASIPLVSGSVLVSGTGYLEFTP